VLSCFRGVLAGTPWLSDNYQVDKLGVRYKFVNLKGCDRLREGYHESRIYSRDTYPESYLGTPTQSHISPSTLVYEDYRGRRESPRGKAGPPNHHDDKVDSDQ